eukprot:TRINITY_DN192_c0_g1_i1.p1 TRINITY_DN192_c0_g1~~TRINITY_DN192_c0_g1_i1.p1  ORF type:complete len:274 (-),score=105.80 TRINITY_DN192_c0_g1_i1:47-868(-)
MKRKSRVYPTNQQQNMKKNQKLMEIEEADFENSRFIDMLTVLDKEDLILLKDLYNWGVFPVDPIIENENETENEEDETDNEEDDENVKTIVIKNHSMSLPLLEHNKSVVAVPTIEEIPVIDEDIEDENHLNKEDSELLMTTANLVENRKISDSPLFSKTNTPVSESNISNNDEDYEENEGQQFDNDYFKSLRFASLNTQTRTLQWQLLKNVKLFVPPPSMSVDDLTNLQLSPRYLNMNNMDRNDDETVIYSEQTVKMRSNLKKLSNSINLLNQ